MDMKCMIRVHQHTNNFYWCIQVTKVLRCLSSFEQTHRL